MNTSAISRLQKTTLENGSDMGKSQEIPPARLTALQKFTRNRFLNSFSNVEVGVLEFEDCLAKLELGNVRGNSVEKASLQVKHPGFYSELALAGNVGFAEAYLKGYWESDNLTQLLAILYRNQARSQNATTFVSTIRKLFHRFARTINGNTVDRSKRHIAAHYDLSNDFFELFLDPTMMYSAGYFIDENATLHDASVAKLEQICDKLELKNGDSVLEIGTGWGGFALHALQNYDIELTTTTISAAQASKARQRFQDAAVSDRIQLLQNDYRNLTGQYDKMVSIEMIEAVGESYLETYFQKCGQLLKPAGKFAIQAIVMPEQRYASYRRNVDFIQKYIFPGGFLPSITSIQEAVGRATDFRLQGIEDLSPHYARTLYEWRIRFLAKLDEVKQLGFDGRFIRMWEYYLCYCEAAFREQAVRVVQIVWDQPPT